MKLNDDGSYSMEVRFDEEDPFLINDIPGMSEWITRQLEKGGHYVWDRSFDPVDFSARMNRLIERGVT